MSILKIQLTTVMLMLCFCLPAYAKKYTIAVLGIKSVSKTASIGAEKIICESLYGSNFEIVEIPVKEIINTKNPDLDKIRELCLNNGADKAVFGEIVRTGSRYQLNYLVVSADDGKVEYSGTVEYYPADLIDNACERAGVDIKNYLSANRPEVYDYSISKYYFLGFIPGAAQKYHNYNVKGDVFFIAEALSLFALAGSYGYMKYNKIQYDNYRSTSSAKYNSLYKSYENSVTIFKVSAGTAAFVYTLNWIDVLFFSNKVNSTPKLWSDYFSYNNGIDDIYSLNLGLTAEF